MKQKKINRQRERLIIIAVGLGLIGLLYYFRSQFIVGLVNGRPIWRVSYVRELEKLAQKQAFDSLTTKILIEAEAKKQNVAVDQNEVDEAMKDIEARAAAQGSNLDELLLAQGVTRAAIQEEVRLQKILEKLIGEVTVTDDQIDNYWQENKEFYFKDKKLEEVKTEITDQLKQQAQIAKIQELISRLQSEAKIINWQN